MNRGDQPGGDTWFRRVTRPIVFALAALYFLIDALFYSVIHPLAMRVANLPVFNRLGAWVRGLGPYPTLVLFLVPVILLEPIKPISAYLFGTGQFTAGCLVLGIGEALKITIVERLFAMSRDKLLTIGWFAWIYWRVMGWIDWLKAMPAWQAMARRVAAIKAAARRLAGTLRTLFEPR